MSVKLSDFGSAMDLKDRLRPEKAAESLQPRFYRAQKSFWASPMIHKLMCLGSEFFLNNSAHLCVGLSFFCALPSAPSVRRRRPPHNPLSHTTWSHTQLSTLSQTHTHAHMQLFDRHNFVAHTCSENSYRITVVECIGRAQTIP